MALDLSTVSDNSFEASDQLLSTGGILLPADLIKLPGRNEILFYVTESGNLILANFVVNIKNGTTIIKKCANSKKTLTSSEKQAVFNDPYSVFPSSATDLSNPHTRCTAPRLDDTGLQPIDSFRYEQITARQNHGTHDQLLDLSEEPLDATMYRQPTTDSSVFAQSSPYDLNELGAFLSQPVLEVLKQHGYPWKEGDSMQDLVLKGHNFSTLLRFVKRLKAYRLAEGMTQSQMSRELVRFVNNGAVFSQVLLSRFERLEVTVRSAFRLLPYIEAWLDQRTGRTQPSTQCPSGDQYPSPSGKKVLSSSRWRKLLRLGLVDDPQTGPKPLDDNAHKLLKPIPIDTLDPQPTFNTDLDTHQTAGTGVNKPMERRKRTHFSEAVVALLAEEYRKNPRPKGVQLTRLAMKTGCHRESVRVWFCNRRQVDARCKSSIP